MKTRKLGFLPSPPPPTGCDCEHLPESCSGLKKEQKETNGNTHTDVDTKIQKKKQVSRINNIVQEFCLEGRSDIKVSLFPYKSFNTQYDLFEFLLFNLASHRFKMKHTVKCMLGKSMPLLYETNLSGGQQENKGWQKRVFNLLLVTRCISLECMTVDFDNQKGTFSPIILMNLTSEITLYCSRKRLSARKKKFLNPHTLSPSLCKGNCSSELPPCSLGIKLLLSVPVRYAQTFSALSTQKPSGVQGLSAP